MKNTTKKLVVFNLAIAILVYCLSGWIELMVFLACVLFSLMLAISVGYADYFINKHKNSKP